MDPRPDHGETSYRGSGRLRGRRALITGGDSGIGRAAAIAYAREGADVAINYLPEEEPDAREVIELIGKEGRNAVAIPGDLRDEQFCRTLVNDSAHQLGALDILVSNAAFQRPAASIEEITTTQFEQTFKTNVFAMFWLTKAALPLLKPGSAIICTTSVQAYAPAANLIDYAMTKAAIKNFVESTSKSLAEKGIRINAVAPGPFWTPIQVASASSPDDIKELAAKTPLKRPGQPVELAGLYVLLASKEDSYATGQVYGSTGGTGEP
jgi:NAD(P)-dependent dehydrogenase (short-subunit alcohol dehydrogenase family)